jgi:hypothetical protein
MEADPTRVPWRLPPALEPFRPLLQVAEGETVESLINAVGPAGPLPDALKPLVVRNRTAVYVQVRLLERLWNAGLLRTRPEPPASPQEPAP